MKFSVVIPNFNGKGVIEKTLAGVMGQDEVIIVDNGSVDGSEKQEGVKLIRNHKNLGFGQAVNIGVRKSKNDWVAVINNDVDLDNRWFTKISKYLKSDVGIVGGVVLDRNGVKVESRGLDLRYIGKAFNIDNGKKYIKNKKSVYEVDGVNGAAFVINKKKFLKIGGFDNDFFAYEEDVDLNMRMKKQGWKRLVVEEAICKHVGGVTSKRMGNLRSRMGFVNWGLILWKHYSFKDLFSNFLGIVRSRMGNLKYFVKETVLVYGWRSWWYLPYWTVVCMASICSKIPRIIFVRINQNGHRN